MHSPLTTVLNPNRQHKQPFHSYFNNPLQTKYLLENNYKTFNYGNTKYIIESFI